MTMYQRIFLAYVKALRERMLATNEGEWELANKKCKIYKKWLDKHFNKGV